MRNGLLAIIIALLALMAAGDAAAALTGARATPGQVRLVGSRTNVISINWQIATTADHNSGAFSDIGTIVDPVAGRLLLTINNVVNVGGTGPFSIRETLRLDAATVQDWISRGVTRAVYSRTFIDAAGSSVSASVVFRLSASGLAATRDAAPANLNVTSLRLEFESGNNTALKEVDEQLRATLTVLYTGAGVLRGRWQLAEPESSDGLPIYRTLALVNKNLMASQRSTLHSPRLPTGRTGKYLLRFCVLLDGVPNLTADAQCPSIELVATGTYQVQGRHQDTVAQIRGLSPNRQNTSSGSIFSWSSLSEAHIYQLQVFELAPAAAKLPASRVESDSAEPRFVTGMLLDGATHESELSELVQSKLQKGRRYLWRVTAHDETGRMIGRSSEASFTYLPAE